MDRWIDGQMDGQFPLCAVMCVAERIQAKLNQSEMNCKET